MNREEKIRRVSLGLIKASVGNSPAYTGRVDASADEMMLMDYGQSVRPLAEALIDVIEAMPEEP